MVPIPNAIEGEGTIDHGQQRYLLKTQGQNHPGWGCMAKAQVFKGVRQRQALQAGLALRAMMRYDLVAINLPLQPGFRRGCRVVGGLLGDECEWPRRFLIRRQP
jgi:hypothetical protein